MSNTGDKMKEGIHDAAEKVKDAGTRSPKRPRMLRTMSARRSRTPRTTFPRRPRTLCTTLARRSRTQGAERSCSKKKAYRVRGGPSSGRGSHSSIKQQIGKEFTCFLFSPA